MTRLVAVAGSSDYPLLSIRENPSGSLVIKPKRARFNIMDGLRRKTTEQKITVHRSNGSANNLNTIHHTLVSEDGHKFETHHVTSAVRDGGVALLYRHRVGDLTDGPPTQTVRTKDARIEIARYAPSSSTLHYLVFLGPAGGATALIEDNPKFIQHSIKFTNFSIIIVAAYSFSPSLPEGNLRYSATAPATLNGIRQGAPSSPSEALCPSDASEYAEIQLTLSHCEQFEIAIELLMEEDPEGKLEPMVKQTFALGILAKPFLPPI